MLSKTLRNGWPDAGKACTQTSVAAAAELRDTIHGVLHKPVKIDYLAQVFLADGLDVNKKILYQIFFLNVMASNDVFFFNNSNDI